MPRALLLVLLTTCLLSAAVSMAAATTVPIGTMTGSGSVTVSGYNPPTAWEFSGTYHFDNTLAIYGGQTLAQIFGDSGQYTFTAHSANNVPAYDWNGNPAAPALYQGDYGWVIDNHSGGAKLSSTFYGSVLSFMFSGTEPTGTVTASLLSDGFVHWYYGYDTDPGGRTPLAALGLSSYSDFMGVYTVTGYPSGGVNYNLTGAFYTDIAVPAPATLWLLGSGLLGLLALRRTRRT
ncbi:MAG: PEP-CTERM sorting domain-containing protein [Deltaproteobacteria bacterium]|nr:PEP-CTERM sorting domain-containing protein [Deltaproteobacteria bacterium]